MTGRFVVSPHFTRWAVRDLGNWDADGPTFDQRYEADARCRQLNAAHTRRIHPPPTLFDKDPDMTEPTPDVVRDASDWIASGGVPLPTDPGGPPPPPPSIWDELDDGDFRRVPDGEKGAGSPLIIPEGGGEPVRYSRFTNFISAVEDDYGIAQWRRHLTVDGILGADNDFIRREWDGADWATKKALSDWAFDAAGGWAKANRGTRMHALTDALDAGKTVVLDDQDAGVEDDLDAYAAAVAAFTPVHIEPRMVYDPYLAAGTPDRIWQIPGYDLPIAGDLKTGDIDGRKCAMQMALAAKAKLYDPKTGRRTPIDVDQNRAIIIHLPYGKAKARVLWVDIAAGWEGVQLCAAVHAWRKRNGLTTVMKPEPVAVVRTLMEAIAEAGTADDLKTLWRDWREQWTDAHTAAAKARLAALAAGTEAAA